MFYVSSVAGNGYLYAGSFRDARARALRRCGNSKRAQLHGSRYYYCAAIASRRRQYFSGNTLFLFTVRRVTRSRRRCVTPSVSVVCAPRVCSDYSEYFSSISPRARQNRESSGMTAVALIARARARLRNDVSRFLLRTSERSRRPTRALDR